MGREKVEMKCVSKEIAMARYRLPQTKVDQGKDCFIKTEIKQAIATYILISRLSGCRQKKKEHCIFVISKRQGFIPHSHTTFRWIKCYLCLLNRKKNTEAKNPCPKQMSEKLRTSTYSTDRNYG